MAAPALIAMATVALWAVGGLTTPMPARAQSASAPSAPVTSERPLLKVLVLKDSPTMSFRNPQGALTGFNVDLALAVCESIQVRCDIAETQLDTVIDDVAKGAADFTTVSLMPTPDRQKKVRFSLPVRWSRSVWISTQAMQSPAPMKVAVIKGSKQLSWVMRESQHRAWTPVVLDHHASLKPALVQGQADAVVAPLSTAVDLLQAVSTPESPHYQVQVIDEPELSLPSSIAVTPLKPELLDRINDAVRELQRNGTLELLNSKYFPLRLL